VRKPCQTAIESGRVTVHDLNARARQLATRGSQVLLLAVAVGHFVLPLLNSKAFARSSGERTGTMLAGLAVWGVKRFLAAGALAVFAAVAVFEVVVVLVPLGAAMIDAFPYH
jgi:hypothetical protein